MARLNQMKNQDGLTLVELLGSIVILSIILVSFLGFFIQSARTTKVSGEIIDASYIAQQQAEEIYNHTNYRSYDELIEYLKSGGSGYTLEPLHPHDKFSITKDGYLIEVIIYPEGTYADLYTLLVKVFDPDRNPAAQVETKFFFERSNETDEG